MRELEFLPEEYLRARLHRRLGFIRSWLLLALALAMALWSLQVGLWVRDARAELQALRGSGSSVEADVEKVRMLQAEARGHGRRLAALTALRGGVGLADVLADLAETLPPEAVLDDVVIQREDEAPAGAVRLRVCGSVPSGALLGRTLGALESSPVFEDVGLVESKAGDGEAHRQFVIEASARPRAAEEPGQ